MPKVQTNRVFEELSDSNTRISVFQGGTRSGKTYNILIWWIVKLSTEQHKILTICRATTPSLKNTVLRDFMEIMQNLGLWQTENFNKSELTYQFGTNVIEFRNLDDEQKIRGAKRHYLYLNEANENPLIIWKQLLFRTTDKIVLDYNPSDEFHWIYDEVITRDDCDFYKSTYIDNPFLSKDIVREIERLRDVDENYWRIYGLGERGISKATIYSNWDTTDEEEPSGRVYYGLDFGFNHPTALIKIVICDGYVWCKQLLYQSQLTNSDLAIKMRELGIGPDDSIYADCARPEAIEELYREGFNVYPTRKGKNSVRDGIDYLKRQKLRITKDSLDLIKEIRSYKWKTDKDERVLEEPVKINDDAMDALRYAFNEEITGREEFVIGTTRLF